MYNVVILKCKTTPLKEMFEQIKKKQVANFIFLLEIPGILLETMLIC